MIRLKEHYSWSQHSLWKTSKRAYYKRYCLGEENITNIYFEKGKELGKYLQSLNENEDNVNHKKLAESMSDDPLLFQLGIDVPYLDIMEDHLEVEIGGHKVISYVDSVDIGNEVFLEYKTGKVDDEGNEPWDQFAVDQHDQLKFYALMYWIKSGRKSIPKCHLIWIETELVPINDELGNYSHDKLMYTGRTDMFERNFIVSELVDYEKEIIKSIEEINEYEHIEIDVNDDIVKHYKHLRDSIKEMQEEMNVIKEGLLIEMQMDDVKYASSESGTFSISNRKTWVYSEILTNTIKDSNKFFKQAKILEQQDGSATHTVKPSLSFKEI